MKKMRTRERGASLTEFAIVVPLFIAMFYGSLYLTDLGNFKIKNQEIARYSTWAFVNHPLSDYGELKHRDYFRDAQNSVADELDTIYPDLDGARQRFIPGAWSSTMAAVYVPPSALDLRNAQVNPLEPVNVSFADPFSSGGMILSMLGIGTDLNSLFSGIFNRIGMNTRGQITGRATVAVLPLSNPRQRAINNEMARFGRARFDTKRGADLSDWTPTYNRIRDGNRPLQCTIIADPWRLTQGWSAHPKSTEEETSHYGNMVKNVSEKTIEAFPGGGLLGSLFRFEDFIPDGLGSAVGIPANQPEAHTFSRPYTSDEYRDSRPTVTEPGIAAPGQLDIFGETGGDPERGAVRRFESMPLYITPRGRTGYLDALEDRGRNFMGCQDEEERGCWD